MSLLESEKHKEFHMFFPKLLLIHYLTGKNKVHFKLSDLLWKYGSLMWHGYPNPLFHPIFTCVLWIEGAVNLNLKYEKNSEVHHRMNPDEEKKS